MEDSLLCKLAPSFK